MKSITLKISPGVPESIAIVGDYIRLKSAGVPVRIQSESGDVDATVEQGDALNLEPFSRVIVSHADAAEQTVTMLIGNGTSADSAKVGGSVAVSYMPATAQAMTQSAPAVGLASAQILAAKPDRRFLMLQNKHASAKIHVNLTGAAAAAADGIMLSPGASLVLDVCVPSGAITAISDVDAITITAVEA